MDLLKISLLLCSAAIHVHSSNTNNIPKPWQYNTRKVNSLPNNHKNCFCYPEGQLPTVHQLLDSQNTGQERVVIYLYKKTGSNDIKMYTPSPDKQALIPDIPYDSGDGLITVSTENVLTLFHNNPNKVKVYDHRIETLIPAATNSLPIGLNMGAIEHIFPSNDYFNSNNSYNGNEYGIDNNIIVANKLNGKKETIHFSHGNVIPNKSFPYQYWTSNNINYPYTKPQAQPNNPQGSLDNVQAFSSNLQGYTFNPQIYPTNHQDFGGLGQHAPYSFQKNERLYKSSSSQQNINNPFSTRYVTFNIWFNQQMKRFQNVHLPHDIKTIDSNVLRMLVQKTLAENNIFVSTRGVITDSKGKVIDSADLELRPLLLGETLNHQILPKLQKSVTLPKHLHYLEGILVTFVSPPQVLGIIPLGKTYLPETKYTSQSMSGLTRVNSSKIYIGSYGNANSASYTTSSLDPYALSVKEAYSEPMKASTSYHTYSSGSGNPVSGYSEISSKPVSYSYSIANQQPQPSVNEATYWSSGPYSSVSNLPYPTSNWNPSANIQPLGKRRKLSDVKIEHHYVPPIKNKKKVKGLSNTSKGNVINEVTTPEPLIDLNSSESGRRFPLPGMKGVMKTLLYLLNDLPSRRDFKLSNSTENFDIINESESETDEGAPDFRIIGGSAATGSGTPLSNKGRSGNIEYF